MFDKSLSLSILLQVDDALKKVAARSGRYLSADEFTASPSGMEALDSICMLFIAVGESLKKIDKITDSALLSQYPEIDWKGVIGFRDVIAHQYFDIDAEQVYWICTRELKPLSAAVQKMIEKLR